MPSAGPPSPPTETAVDFFADLRHLLGRAARRPVLCCVLAVLLGGAIFARAMRRQQTYHTRLVMRVSERGFDRSTAVPGARRLKSFVKDVAFSYDALLAIVRKHDLYPRLLVRDPVLAVDSFREDIEVDVWQNFLGIFTSDSDMERSARIEIDYMARDPKVAFDVVQALGNLVNESEGKARSFIAGHAAQITDEGAEKLSEEIDERRHAVLVAEAAVSRGEMQALPALTSDQQVLRRLQGQLAKRNKLRTSMHLRHSFEEARHGLHFEIVDRGHMQRPARRLRILATGGSAFLASFVLVALGVGAFDPRVYSSEDVRRLGLPVLGELSSWRASTPWRQDLPSS